MTREAMAHRVAVVSKIAQGKSKKHVQLSQRGYLHWSQPRATPGFGAKKRPLEGFLFPATYDFLANTTSRQLVESQLSAFQANWKKVDMSYARKKNLTPYDVLIIASMVEGETIAPDERPKVAAVIIVVAVAFTLLGGIGYVVSDLMVELAGELSSEETKDRIEGKVDRLLARWGNNDGVVSRLSALFDSVRENFEGDAPAASDAADGQAALRIGLRAQASANLNGGYEWKRSALSST